VVLLKERKVRVYVDIREEKSNIPKLLEKEGILVIRRKLDVGDYLVSEDSVVERKTVYDFASSLFDGRLFDQARRLKETYENIYYVIEGSLKSLEYRWGDRFKQLSAALVTLSVDFDAKILWSVDESNTAYLIASLAKSLQCSEGRVGIVLHKKPRLSSIEEWQLYILQSFPGVGPKLALAILNEFGSLERFCTASFTELSRVPGLGEKRAELIKRLLKAPFRKAKHRRSYSLSDFIDLGEKETK
jgi:DNA excision repair protein ERCC-4